jgi:hypothetical protein
MTLPLPVVRQEVLLAGILERPPCHVHATHALPATDHCPISPLTSRLRLFTSLKVNGRIGRAGLGTHKVPASTGSNRL